MKKDLVKKIVSISAVSLVIALVVATIVLALVPKKLVNPINNGYASITVYKDSLDKQYFKNFYNSATATEAEKKYNAVYDEITEMHEDSLQDNLLSAMFQGLGKFGVKVVASLKSDVIKDVAKADGNCLVFTYIQEEKLVLKINGEVYYDETSLKSEAVEYDMIVMPLISSSGFEERIIYLADRETGKSQYQLKFLADQSVLNDYIENLNLGIAA